MYASVRSLCSTSETNIVYQLFQLKNINTYILRYSYKK